MASTFSQQNGHGVLIHKQRTKGELRLNFYGAVSGCNCKRINYAFVAWIRICRSNGVLTVGMIQQHRHDVSPSARAYIDWKVERTLDLVERLSRRRPEHLQVKEVLSILQ